MRRSFGQDLPERVVEVTATTLRRPAAARFGIAVATGIAQSPITHP
ncbi:hypothetical protein ACLBWX_13270 [Methylobacterium sp. M6A4_1b]